MLVKLVAMCMTFATMASYVGDNSSELDPGTDDITTHASQPLSGIIRAKFHSLFHHFFGFLVLWQAAFNVSNAAISAFHF